MHTLSGGVSVAFEPPALPITGERNDYETQDNHTDDSSCTNTFEHGNTTPEIRICPSDNRKNRGLDDRKHKHQFHKHVTAANGTQLPTWILCR